jgi:hypothetical protein
MIRRFPHDPLGRSEPDATERLKAMAEDALAKRHEEAVEREADRARQVLGLKPKAADNKATN